jgi:transposase
MDLVVIGMDPHKRSVSIEARDTREVLQATARFGTDTANYRALLRLARRWPERVWAVEGANGIGGPIAQRLLADRERVSDVPAKLAARARVFDTGQGRKTDATDARSIVMVALRDKGLRELSVHSQLMVLRLLCDRRDELSHAGADLEPDAPTVPGVAAGWGAAEEVHRAIQGDARLGAPAGHGRQDAAPDGGRGAGRAGALRIDTRLKAMNAELTALVLARGSHLMDLHGIGPVGAARVLADVGDVARFPDRNHFASWTGTAPIDASSGEQIRHRLSRAGNRRMNHVLYMAGIVQLRNDTEGRAYYRRKLTQSKTSTEAMRCLRRRLSDVVYRQLRADADTAKPTVDGAGPGGHSGATTKSSATDLTPDIGSSDKPLPEPASGTLPAHPAASQNTVSGNSRPPRRRTGGVNVERPTGRTTLTPTSTAAHSPASRRPPLDDTTS